MAVYCTDLLVRQPPICSSPRSAVRSLSLPGGCPRLASCGAAFFWPSSFALDLAPAGAARWPDRRPRVVPGPSPTFAPRLRPFAALYLAAVGRAARCPALEQLDACKQLPAIAPNDVAFVSRY